VGEEEQCPSRPRGSANPLATKKLLGKLMEYPEELL
jgi:hypothetical protein